MKVQCAGIVHDHKEVEALVKAANKFWLVGGDQTDVFEKDLKKFFNARHAVMCNSGSSANLLMVSAATSRTLGRNRLKKGDEVIVSASSFPTTINPVIQNGLVPVFIEPNLNDLNFNYKNLNRALSKKTKAIIVCHTLGIPARMDLIRDFCFQNRLMMLEDNCDGQVAHTEVS